MIHLLGKGQASLGEAGLEKLQGDPELLERALWIDLHSPTGEEKDFIAKYAGVDLPTKEEMHEIEESSRLFEEDAALFMSCWMLSYDTPIPENASVTFIVTRKRLISIRFSDHHPFRVFATPRKRTAGRRFQTSDEVFVELLDVIIGHIASTLRLVEQSLNTLSLEIFSEQEKERRDGRPTGLKLVVQQLGKRNSLVSSLRESTLSLSMLTRFFTAGVESALAAELSSRVEILERDIHSLREYDSQLSAEINFLLDSTVGLISIEQNQSMKILSVAALVLAFI